jgi:hypothetical protein
MKKFLKLLLGLALAFVGVQGVWASGAVDRGALDDGSFELTGLNHRRYRRLESTRKEDFIEQDHIFFYEYGLRLAAKRSVDVDPLRDLKELSNELQQKYGYISDEEGSIADAFSHIRACEEDWMKLKRIKFFLDQHPDKDTIHLTNARECLFKVLRSDSGLKLSGGGAIFISPVYSSEDKLRFVCNAFRSINRYLRSKGVVLGAAAIYAAGVGGAGVYAGEQRVEALASDGDKAPTVDSKLAERQRLLESLRAFNKDFSTAEREAGKLIELLTSMIDLSSQLNEQYSADIRVIPGMKQLSLDLTNSDSVKYFDSKRLGIVGSLNKSIDAMLAE